MSEFLRIIFLFQLQFAQRVQPTKIEIFENLNGGAVVAVKGKDENGDWVSFWESDQPTLTEENTNFSPDIQVSHFHFVGSFTYFSTFNDNTLKG